MKSRLFRTTRQLRAALEADARLPLAERGQACSNPDGFDRLITAWLDELAPMREPDGLLDAVTGQMKRTRRLPGWALLERWLPMQTRAKFGAIAGPRIILVTLGILAAMLLTAVAIGAQPSSKSDLAPLFGVAGNGRVYSDSGGIYRDETRARNSRSRSSRTPSSSCIHHDQRRQPSDLSAQRWRQLRAHDRGSRWQ